MMAGFYPAPSTPDNFPHDLSHWFHKHINARFLGFLELRIALALLLFAGGLCCRP